MRRRDFLGVLGGAAATWPLVARAQKPAMPLVGFLHASSFAAAAKQREAFNKGLREGGYVAGQNVAIEYRWADGQYDLLPALAAELVQRNVVVLVAGGGSLPALAAKKETSTIPILFGSGEDPVKRGLVASFARSGGNVTGAVFFSTELAAKRLEVLRELLPAANSISVLINPTNPETETERQQLQLAARGLELNVFSASRESDLESVFADIVKQSSNAIFVCSDTFFVSRRTQLVMLASRYKVPAIFPVREYVDAGGLISYGTSIAEAYHQVGLYAARILKGAKPAELPVVQPTKFELVINLRTAKALGLTVPPTLLARADEVIE